MHGFRTFLAVSLFSSISFSAPSIYLNANTTLKSIHNISKAKFVGDSLNPNIIYVMPPSSTLVKVNNFKATTNLAFCEELSELVVYSRTRTHELARLATERDKVLRELMSLQGKKNDPNVAQRIKVLDEEYLKLESRVTALKSVFDGLYDKFAKREGGFATFSYDSGWDEQVKQLTLDNPGYQFEKIFTRDVKVYARFIGATDVAAYEASIPAVLDYVINGEAHNSTSAKPQALSTLPGIMVGHMRLSLAGACALAKPYLFNIKKDYRGVPVFAVTATYKYPSVFNTNVRVTYDRRTVYKTIKKQSSGIGLFGNRAMKNVVEQNEAWANMKVEWFDDSEGAISEVEKQKTITELRKEVVSEILEMVGVPSPEKVSEEESSLPQPKKDDEGNVLDSIGDKLFGACGATGEFFCIAGGFIIKGLSLLFGGDKAEQEFYRENSAVVTRDFSSKTARLRPGITVFGVDAKN